MASIRELMKQAEQEIRQPILTIGHAADLLMRLTSLLNTCAAEIREADLAYNTTLLGLLEGGEAAVRARVRASTLPEYARQQEARDTQKALIEMVRALKYFLKSREDEVRARAS